ncbi:MAG: hypothetical protein ACQEXV_24105 [Bacillota bacterium]
MKYVVENVEIYREGDVWSTRPIGSEFPPAPGNPATILRFVLDCYAQVERESDTLRELLMLAYQDAEEVGETLKSEQARKVDHIQGGF